ncbi:hypothetical protein BGZ95_000565 [Linnemannia exigua]|uniref:NTF2-domain-containing protein n=1 Tax=Linnemannia exigua TaxID=604196 RepID=A0AAD4H3D5_9FUNG|nr:hypothetical protein BGZ95_000565 [Linnemannia exigua]
MTAPTATTLAPSPTVNSNSINTDPKVANEVGIVFAHEFYTFLNKDPARLHCFYNKNSTMSHGYQGEDIQFFSGQQAINEKIMDLDFEDCKVLVSNLDSQGSIHGGIVVQVLGEMSNRGGPAQKFVQTFFLAEQPKGYYVHNDIFRFLKDDHEEEQEEEEEDEDLTEMYAEKEVEQDEDSQVETFLPAGAVVVAVETAPVEVKVTATHEPVVAPAPIKTPHQEEKVDKKPGPVELVKAEPAPVAAPVEPAQPVQSEPTPEPAPAGPPKAKTWANLAAKAPVTPAVPSSAPVKLQTPTPTPTPASVSYNQGQGQGQGQHHGQGYQLGQGQGQGQGQGRRFVEYHSIFIKNVNDRITEEQLREAFSRFGRIKHLDMTQKKNCAFMDFATPESVVAALKQRNVQVGNEVVLAEERRRGNHGLNNNNFNNNNNNNNGPGGPANGRYGGNHNHFNNNVNGHHQQQQQPQGAHRGGRGNSNGVRGGGGPPDRKPTPNKPTQGVKS